jgi:putative redox protein
MSLQVHKAPQGLLQHEIDIRQHRLITDEDATLGGEDAGPNPHDLLDAALGACTALTLTLYAKRKGMALQDVRVTITHDETPGLYRLHRQVELIGSLDDAQRTRLIEIANKCPIHKVLAGSIEIDTSLA